MKDPLDETVLIATFVIGALFGVLFATAVFLVLG